MKYHQLGKYRRRLVIGELYVIKSGLSPYPWYLAKFLGKGYFRFLRFDDYKPIEPIDTPTDNALIRKANKKEIQTYIERQI